MPSLDNLSDFSDEPDAAVIADVARRSAAIAGDDVGLFETDLDGYVVRVLRTDERLTEKDVEHLLAAPRTARGVATLTSASAFAAYVRRLADEHTTVWADPADQDGCVVAVFNDHTRTDGGAASAPGWRDHRAVYRPVIDEDWLAWTRISGALNPKEAFADFLLDHTHNIATPPPADLVELAQTVSATKTADFEDEVDLANGTYKIGYKKTGKITTNGVLEWPAEITIRVPVFAGEGGQPVDEADRANIRGRLRWDTEGSRLLLGVTLQQVALARRSAFAREVARIRDALPAEVLVVDGPAPAAVIPTSPPRQHATRS